MLDPRCAARSPVGLLSTACIVLGSTGVASAQGTPGSAFLAAQPSPSGCTPPTGPVAGLLAGGVQRACAEPPSSAPPARVEAHDEIGELPEHLGEGLEWRPARTPGQSGLGNAIVRRWLGGPAPPSEQRAEDLGNALTVALLSSQFLSDLTLQGRLYVEGDYWFEVLMLDSMAHGLAQSIAWIGREAAEVDDPALLCDPQDPTCNPYRARPSGRATLAFTSASLVCLHQQMSGARDLGRCAGALAVAGTVGAMRAFSEEHRFSDVLISAGVGVFAGYLLPMATFYRFGTRRLLARPRPEEGWKGVQTWLRPSFSTRGMGVRAEGRF